MEDGGHRILAGLDIVKQPSHGELLAAYLRGIIFDRTRASDPDKAGQAQKRDNQAEAGNQDAQNHSFGDPVLPRQCHVYSLAARQKSRDPLRGRRSER